MVGAVNRSDSKRRVETFVSNIVKEFKKFPARSLLLHGQLAPAEMTVVELQQASVQLRRHGVRFLVEFDGGKQGPQLFMMSC